MKSEPTETASIWNSLKRVLMESVIHLKEGFQQAAYWVLTYWWTSGLVASYEVYTYSFVSVFCWYKMLYLSYVNHHIKDVNFGKQETEKTTRASDFDEQL